MRKIILNLAISLDGFIADNDDGFDWIHGDGNTSNDTEKKFDFQEFTDSVDIIVMGRKAYDDCPIETLESFKDKKIYVATSRELEKTHDNVKVINEDICSLILDLKKEEGKDIWLFGGAKLVDSFIKEDIIDEYIIGIIPVILGKGIPLFLDNNPRINLHLTESTVQEGIVISKYIKRK